MKKKTEKIHYKKFSQRVDDEIQEWLKKEKGKYKSWNLFFREIKKRYEPRKDA